MVKYTDEELNILSEQVESCDPIGMLKEIKDWQCETKSETVINVLDSVTDIIVNNTTWS